MNRGGLPIAAGKLVHHLALGDLDVSDRNGKSEILDKEFDRRLAETDLADERVIAAVAALRRIGEPEQETFVAARQILQPSVAPGGKR